MHSATGIFPPDELVDVLWHNDEIDNPSSALKNLVYRVRTILVSHGIPGAKNIILCQRGTYSWNNALTTTVDIEEFERLIREADEKESQPAEPNWTFICRRFPIIKETCCPSPPLKNGSSRFPPIITACM